MIDGGYGCFVYLLLLHRLGRLINTVLWLRRHNRDTYKSHKDTKLLMAVCKVMQESLANPEAPRYLLGNTIGEEYRHWRRCKEGLPPRYRLFFLFSSAQRQCVYAWLNDEKTLRKEGARTDVYANFRRLLECGVIPSSIAELLQKSSSWDAAEKLLQALE